LATFNLSLSHETGRKQMAIFVAIMQLKIFHQQQQKKKKYRPCLSPEKTFFHSFPKEIYLIPIPMRLNKTVE